MVEPALRLAIVASLAACGGKPVQIPASPAVPVATPPPAPVCPFDYLPASPPAVHAFGDAKAALAWLKTDSLGDPDDDIDLGELAKEHAGAFGVSIKFKAYAGSTRGYHQFAVFVAAARVVVVGKLGDTGTSLPPRCAMMPMDEVIEARLASSPRYPHLGHYRYRRSGVTDQPTFPDVPMVTTDPACPPHAATFRIEDHFVDLDRGEEIMAIDEVYRAPSTRPEPGPTLPIAQLTFDENGVVLPATIGPPSCDHTFRWPWPDHE